METWRYEINTFEVATRGSLKLTDILLRDHVARLVKCLQKVPGDVDFQAMHGRAASALSQWSGAYLAYRAARSVYKARTRTVYTLLESIPAKLDDWDLSIQTAGGPTRPFKSDKPAYLELFPLGRTPFTSGALDQRIAALETLLVNMSAHSTLSGILSEVQTFTGELRAARNEQQGEEGGTEANSTSMETLRLEVTRAMNRNLGRAIEKHGDGPMIGKYFDLSYIRDGATPPPDDAPAAPLNLTLTSGGSGTVNAAWTAVPGVTSYSLYRRLPGEPGWTKMGETSGPGMAVAGQPTGVEMEYAVAASNDAGEGAKSVPESITL